MKKMLRGFRTMLRLRPINVLNAVDSPVLRRTAREAKRVCYVRSVPEWFSHTVNDMFFREADWLFCPVHDRAEPERLHEYRKATYFVVSGYGHAEEAARAHEQGCILVGVRADVHPRIPIIECRPWDPVAVFTALKLLENWHLRKLLTSEPGGGLRPTLSSRTVTVLVNGMRPIAHVWYLLKRALIVYNTEGFRPLLVKVRNYFYKSRGIRWGVLTRI